jgi:hypothetical protein
MSSSTKINTAGNKTKQHHGEATNEGEEGCCPQEVGHEAPHESQKEINDSSFFHWGCVSDIPVM